MLTPFHRGVSSQTSAAAPVGTVTVNAAGRAVLVFGTSLAVVFARVFLSEVACLIVFPCESIFSCTRSTESGTC